MLRRNLDYDQNVPITELGAAALDDLLERGDLESWVPLAQAVQSEPHGGLADTILRLCESHEMYGTSNMWITWIERLRRQSGGLASIRRQRGLTQQQLSERLGISQSDVSKLERRANQRVSTLRAYVEATGGRLRLKAVYSDVEIDVEMGESFSPARLRRG